MRLFFASALFLSALLPGSAQTANKSVPDLPKDPREILEAAAPFYDFSTPGMKPWHLKASYQLYDLDGKPAEQGTWEYWWASPKVYHSSWTRAGSEHARWSTAAGDQYSKDAGSPLRYFERTMPDTFLFPLPPARALESGRMKLDLKMLPPNKPELECVLTTLQWIVDGKPQAPNSSMPNDYCFDPPTLALRMTYSNNLTKQFGQIVKTQGHYLARQVVVTDGKQKRFSVSVDTLEAVSPENAVFTPPEDASLQQRKSALRDTGQTGVTVGTLVKKAPPQYPILSKVAREQGVVVLAATIGVDGRMHDIEVLSSPSALLGRSALEAVRQWEYKPYLLNGVAVEVETVVNVTFSLGR